MLNETPKKNNKEEEKRRLLFIKKYNSSSDANGKIMSQIKEYIKQTKLLELSDTIKLGKLETLKGPRYDKEKKLIPYSFVGPDRFFIIYRREAIKNAKNVSPIFKHLHKQEKNNKDKSDINMTSKFLKALPKYNNRNINNINTEKIKNKPLPKIMKAKLKNQEHILKRLFTYENIQTNIENLISKRTKKNKLNILMNLNKSSTSKNNNYIKTDDINANLKNWNFKLRNPKEHGKYKRNGYLKLTSLNDDLFSVINLNKTNQFFPFKQGKLVNLKLVGKNILEKRIVANQKKGNKNSENSSSIKLGSRRNSKAADFSFNEKTERNLSINFEDKIFAMNYNYTPKYNRKKNKDKFYLNENIY